MPALPPCTFVSPTSPPNLRSSPPFLHDRRSSSNRTSLAPPHPPIFTAETSRTVRIVSADLNFEKRRPTPSCSFGITVLFSSKLKPSHYCSDLVCVYHILSALFTLAGCHCLALTLKTVPHKSPAPSHLKSDFELNPLTRFLHRFRIASSFPLSLLSLLPGLLQFAVLSHLHYVIYSAQDNNQVQYLDLTHATTVKVNMRFRAETILNLSFTLCNIPLHKQTIIMMR